MGKTKDVLLPPIRVDEELMKELDKLVYRFGYRSRSELVREALRDKISELKGMDIVQIREVSKEKAKEEILEYIPGRDRVYAYEIANELRLDLSLTFEVIEELFKEGKLEEV